MEDQHEKLTMEMREKFNLTIGEAYDAARGRVDLAVSSRALKVAERDGIPFSDALKKALAENPKLAELYYEELGVVIDGRPVYNTPDE